MVRSPHLKIHEIPGERGVIKNLPGKENPGGVQIKESSVGSGSMDIFWNHTIIMKIS